MAVPNVAVVACWFPDVLDVGLAKVPRSEAKAFWLPRVDANTNTPEESHSWSCKQRSQTVMYGPGLLF